MPDGEAGGKRRRRVRIDAVDEEVRREIGAEPVQMEQRDVGLCDQIHRVDCRDGGESHDKPFGGSIHLAPGEERQRDREP